MHIAVLLVKHLPPLNINGLIKYTIGWSDTGMILKQTYRIINHKILIYRYLNSCETHNAQRIFCGRPFLMMMKGKNYFNFYLMIRLSHNTFFTNKRIGVKRISKSNSIMERADFKRFGIRNSTE